ncbi:MAG: insulinase family protein [Bacteroidota bacterium]
MKKYTIYLSLLLMVAASFFISCNKKVKDVTTTNPPVAETEMVGVATTELPKYDYESVPGDPIGVKIYTLKNGMKVYMSVNKKEPRINTSIAVRAGSKHDPADATGLAHYLEHMLFKGTSNVGSLDWAAEKLLLEEISDLYEQHRNETDPEKRKALYAKIDEKSNEAAKLVAANEYDKMVSSLGAKGTNAYTSVEQTVYINDIPANELERWMQLESERFQELVLRLFHTELEAVYEEYNRGLDSDGRKAFMAMLEGLFPNHNYGLQTTIGKGEHLKNPSHVKIHEYFNKYYVPNNMGLIVAGDFDPDEMVDLAEKYFGSYEPKDVEKYTFEKSQPFTQKVVKEVKGQEAEFLNMAWKFGGAHTGDPLMLEMISGLLYNTQAGIMDIDLIQKQKLLNTYSWTYELEDYAAFIMYGKPREGQSLEDVEVLLLDALEKVKRGEFEEWLMKAVIKNGKLQEIQSNESNGARNRQMVDSYVMNKQWSDNVNYWKRMEAITKKQVVDFANQHFTKNNYVVVYKRSGEDKSIEKVEKPAITPVSLNREEMSPYTKKFMAQEVARLEPVFVDYKNEISTYQLNGSVKMDYIKNKNNATFEMDYIVEMGGNSEKLLPLAVSYLPYLGTDKYTPEQLQQEFFKLGLSFDVYAGNERVYVTLSGLDESFAEGVQLFEHILANVKGDEAALKNVIADIMQQRANAKKDKRTILRSGMSNYAKYGPTSAFTDKLSEKELNAINPAQLIEKIKGLTSFEHQVFYYGSKSADAVKSTLNKFHKSPARLKPVIPAKKYPEIKTPKDKIYFVNHDMVQAEVLLLSKGTPTFNLDEYVMSELYNTYFGFGLSSIVFQEIRESKALAYSAYAYYSSPSKKDKGHYMNAYVGTQADKLKEAVAAMQEIIEDMPFSPEQIEQARQAILKKYESERVNDGSKYWAYRGAKDKGYERDLREDIYNRIKTVTPAELKAFQEKYVKGRNYVICVLGNKENVDLEYLKTLGEVEELTKEQIFGY